MAPKVDVPYLWIRPLCLVSLDLAYGLLYIIMDRICIPVIILHLSIAEKKNHSIATTTKLRNLKLLIAKTHLMHLFYFMNWLTYKFWTRTGGWEFDYSNGAGTSSPSSRSRNKRRNLWVGRLVSSWWHLFPSRNSVLIYIYIYVCILYTYICIYIYIYIYMRIYTYTGSAIQYWWSCTPSQSIGPVWWSARFLCWMALVFYGFTICVLLYDK